MFVTRPPSIHWGQAQKLSTAQANLAEVNFKTDWKQLHIYLPSWGVEERRPKIEPSRQAPPWAPLPSPEKFFAQPFILFSPHLLVVLGGTWSFPVEASIPSLLAFSLSVNPGVIMNSDIIVFKARLSQCHLSWVLSVQLKSLSIMYQSTYLLSWDVHKKMTSKGSYHLAPKFLSFLFQSGSSVESRTHTRNFKGN